MLTPPTLKRCSKIPALSYRLLALFIAAFHSFVASAADSSKPNILVWMMDDVGFAQISRYGGLVATPNIDKMARRGLFYTNYRTAPICSASRASLLTGRMPHTVHIGGHATAARNFPGYNGRIPKSAGTLAANLREAGYLTAALGKWDHLPSEHASPAGPFDYWPTGQGFERFYGFLAADTDNWNPTLINGTSPIATPDQPGYHLSADIADKAIEIISSRNAVNNPRPFFIYWATGIAHSPHHAPEEWIKQYEGKFDSGWDVARDTILSNQKTLGLMPQQAVLAERPAEMPAWDSLSVDEKKLYARQMEVFAGSLSHSDAQFGRIIDWLESNGELDNTIVLVTSDNGASAEGGPNGLYNEAQVVAAKKPSVKENLEYIDKWGGPGTFPHYAFGWAVAGNTPFRYYKQTTHEGGTRVPLVISWPKSINAKNSERQQFVHVSDIAPTLLDAAGVKLASHINNVKQQPMQGKSIKATFDSTGTPDESAQYAELYGNKALWWKNWSLVTSHRHKTWDFKTSSTFDEPWELYDLSNDPGQTNDISESHPEIVARMAKQFEEFALRDNIHPQHNLSDTSRESYERSLEDFRQRKGRWHYTGVISNIPQALAPPVAFRDFTMNAYVEPAHKRVTGPIFAYGGQLGGIALYLDRGKPVFIVNSLGGESETVEAKKRLDTERIKLSLDVKKVTNAKAFSHYEISIAANEEIVASATVKTPIPLYFGLPETFGVGRDEGSPVLKSFRAGNTFEGKLTNVEFVFQGAAGSGDWVH